MTPYGLFRLKKKKKQSECAGRSIVRGVAAENEAADLRPPKFFLGAYPHPHLSPFTLAPGRLALKVPRLFASMVSTMTARATPGA